MEQSEEAQPVTTQSPRAPLFPNPLPARLLHLPSPPPRPSAADVPLLPRPPRRSRRRPRVVEHGPPRVLPSPKEATGVASPRRFAGPCLTQLPSLPPSPSSIPVSFFQLDEKLVKSYGRSARSATSTHHQVPRPAGRPQVHTNIQYNVLVVKIWLNVIFRWCGTKCLDLDVRKYLRNSHHLSTNKPKLWWQYLCYEAGMMYESGSSSCLMSDYHVLSLEKESVPRRCMEYLDYDAPRFDAQLHTPQALPKPDFLIGAQLEQYGSPPHQKRTSS